MHPHKSESWVDRIEETIIAVLLGCMTVITFANVVARYVFNHNILWALELTVFMFGWLVLLGASYAVKKNAHLGVDAVINMLSPKGRSLMAMISITVCILFTLLLLKGSWDYWSNFANLPQTTGRVFPTGFEDEFRPKGWYETNDIPHPAILGWMETVFNEGDEYEKLPRLVPYLVLPLSMGLLLWRFLQVARSIWTGGQDRMIASHEAEDELEEVREQLGKDD